MRVTLVSGSTKENSTVLKLCRYIAQCMEAEGHEARIFDQATMPLPVMCETEKYDDHEHVNNLKDWLNEADGIVLATPEYHGAMSGALKNALDFLWPQFGGKPVTVASIAGGAVGVSSLLMLQTIMRQVHAINSPEWISLCGADRGFNEDGTPEDEKVAERIQKACAKLSFLMKALR